MKVIRGHKRFVVLKFILFEKNLIYISKSGTVSISNIDIFIDGLRIKKK